MLNTRELVSKYNIKLTKSLGQNFLVDNRIVDRIVEAAQVSSKDLVIEIGPGVGSMTTALAEKAGYVKAIEIDRHLIPALKDNLKDFANVEIINKDVMEIDFPREVLNQENAGFKPEKIKVVSNLPYYITTPIIMMLLEQELGIDMMLFMVQKEVADRMVANPGKKDYGALSVAVQYYSNPTKVFDVPPHCFMPQPDVDSTVIRLDISKEPPVHVKSRELFFKIVKASFGQRRKTLVNALYNSGYFNLDKEQIKETLNTIGIHENQRGETLTILQFAQLANSFLGKDC